jgi:ribosomal protein S18 acetylase RimI-like enzyme
VSDNSRRIEVVTWYLEMTAREDLVPHGSAPERLDLVEVPDPAPEFAWFLYAAVGRRWGWVDRLGWTRKEWREHGAREDVSLQVARLGGGPVGYVELRLELPRSVQIEYLGLLPDVMGQGLGGELLTRAVRSAWSWRPGRVWLHTCSLDAPAALENYRARGFRIYDETREERELPLDPPVGWPE